MSDRIIENPVINSPYREPERHYEFDEEGITNTIVPEHRLSQYPIETGIICGGSSPPRL